MQLGLIARCEADLSRGLAAQTHTFYRHLKPARTLVILMEADQAIFDQDPSQYDSPDGDVVIVRQSELTEPVFKSFAQGLDVILSCETFYADPLPDWARDLGVRTALQFNMEFLRYPSDPILPRPDLFISPSSWMSDKWPFGTIHLPTPIDRKVFPFTLRRSASTFLHIVGNRATGDRAGTHLLGTASRHLPASLRLVIRTQSRLPVDLFSRSTCITDVVQASPSVSTLYSLGDVLVAPRRYGGQSLVLDQAASLGLPVIALNRIPESSLLPSSCLVPCNEWTSVGMPSGQITLYQCRPADLSSRIEQFFSSPLVVEETSRAMDRYAESVSWPALLPVWTKTLEDLANGEKVSARQARPSV